MRHTGIDVIGDVPWGTHFCQFYQDARDLTEILVPYFKAGLENNEFCMWVTSEPLRAEEAEAALAREVPDLDAYLRNGQIEILEYSDWYTAGGGFDSDRLLQAWVDRLEAARSRGFDGLRLTGNTLWLEKPDWRGSTGYEAAVDGVIGRYPMLAICTYSLSRCGVVEIMDVVSNHAFALIKRAGKWQIIESAERKRVEAALRESEESLRVAAMAAEVGIWAWSPETGDLVVSDNWRSTFGIPPYVPVTMDTWREALHPEDRGRVLEELDAASRLGREFNAEYRVVRPDGSLRWLADRGRPACGGHGRPTGMAGVNLDITARRQAEEALRQQREWLSVTLTSIGDAVLATDTAGKVTFLNRVAAELTGWNEEQALGRQVQDVFRIIDEETHAASPDIVAEVLRDRSVVSLANHTALVTRDGREVPIEDSAAPIQDSSGKLSGAVLVFHDVTEKRRAQEALHQSELRVRQKLDSILSPEGDIGDLPLGDSLDGSAIQSLMDDFYELARIPMALIDLQGEVLVGVGWQDICTRFHRVHPETCKHCIESDTQLSAGVPAGEFRLYKCKNHMWDISTPLVIGGRHVGNLFSGQFFFEGEPLDYDLFRAQARQYGFPEDRYLAALDNVPRMSRKAVDRGMAFLSKLGHMLSLLSYSNIKLARSLAERDNLMSSLRRSEALYRGIAGNLPEGAVYVVDREMRYVVAEGGLLARIGQEKKKLEGRTLREALHGEALRLEEPYWQSALAGEPGSQEIVSGDIILWRQYTPLRDDRGEVVAALALSQDISARKRDEEQMRHAQKLESIGLLAGGIAHDFNNLLVGIIGNASLAQDMIAETSPAHDSLSRIIQSGEQAAHLTRQMLAYAGKGRFVIESVNLSALVKENSGLMQSSIARKIAIQLDLAPELPVVESDRGQMQQVFMNLAINAAEAIGSGSGTVSISTGVMDVDAAFIRTELEGWDMRPGRCAYLEVRDTGCGMDAETRAKIFDPFFSTKFQGRGLGLAAVAGIVRSHKGAIQLTSAPGAGSTFRVLLPAVTAGAGAVARQAEPQDLSGRGTVLVVDDEKVVRDVARCSLERHGYNVLVAESGPAAIEALRAEGSRIRLVVLDLSMPGMSGEETLPHLRRLHPDLEVIVSSGFSEMEALRLFQGAEVSGFIQKPYTAQQLAREVKAVLA